MARRARFFAQLPLLILAQPLAPGIGEEPIGAAGQVAEVIPDARRAAGGRPDLIDRQLRDHTFHVLEGLQQRMRGRHHKRGYAIDRPAQPVFGVARHAA